MKLRFCFYGFMVMLLGVANGARADIRLPKLFSDHMVLQRDLADAVWGWADPGEKITVTLAGQTATATTDDYGNWLARLAPLKAGGPHELVVAGKNKITLQDVLVGDVWVCSGEGMDSSLSINENGAASVAAATNTRIRFLSAKGPSTPEPAIDVPNGWLICNPQTAGDLSAVGYFFGKRIQSETGVPIGLIDNSWLGTPANTWINPEGVRLFPDLAGVMKGYDDCNATNAVEKAKYLDETAHWLEVARAAQAHGKKIPAPPAREFPGFIYPAVYNGRVAPLTHYGIKGVLWYESPAWGGAGSLRTHDQVSLIVVWHQGGADKEIEYNQMRALVGGWRAAWNQGEFPFYYVQMPNSSTAKSNPAGGDGESTIREAQLKALQIPHTGLAVSLDIGIGNFRHPANAEDIGNRLALWALKNDYGRTNLVCSGPLYKGMKIEDDKIRISFDSVGSGLMVGKKEGHGPVKEVSDGALQKFAIAGENKEWVWADAEIDGATVVVSNPGVLRPVAVRYAYAANAEGCNLYNKEGLPAAPFRTDAW